MQFKSENAVLNVRTSISRGFYNSRTDFWELKTAVRYRNSKYYPRCPIIYLPNF